MSEDKKTEEEFGIPEKSKIKRRSYNMSPAAQKTREENAQKSTGPNTEEGKARSSRNSLKHGLYASTLLTGIIGRPCRSTCDKFDNCELVSDGNVVPGDHCLDKQFVAEAFDSVIRAIKAKDASDQDGFQALAALEIAGSIDIFRKIKEAIIEDGVVLKEEKHDKDGKFIGWVFKPHPLLFHYEKMLEKLNFTPSDFNLTPAAIAKVNKNKADDENTKTLADTLSDIGSSLKKSREKGAKK